MVGDVALRRLCPTRRNEAGKSSEMACRYWARSQWMSVFNDSLFSRLFVADHAHLFEFSVAN